MLADWIEMYGARTPTDEYGFASADISITGPRPAWTTQ
jgi:hypothetical protein